MSRFFCFKVGLVLAGVWVGTLPVAQGGDVADVTMRVDVASAYLFKGVTLADGPVVQPWVEAGGFSIPETFGYLLLGAWGNYALDDYHWIADEYQFSEVDLYAFYTLPIPFLETSIGYTEYIYPNNGVLEMDREVSLWLRMPVGRFAVSGAAFLGIDGYIEEQKYYEAALDYTFALSEKTDLKTEIHAGYLDSDDRGTGWHDGSLSAELTHALGQRLSVAAFAAYVFQLDDEVLFDAQDIPGYGFVPGYDVELYGMLSLIYSF
jgi:hypothetical protein